MEERVEKLENRYNELRENQDKHLEIQADILGQLKEIGSQQKDMHVFLLGTEYDKAGGNGLGGGVSQRLVRLEEDNKDTEKFKTRMRLRVAIGWGVIGLAGSAIVMKLTGLLDKIIGK